MKEETLCNPEASETPDEKQVVGDALLSAIESLDAAVDGWKIDASLPSKGSGVTIKAWKRFKENEAAVTKYFGSTKKSESRATNIICAASKIHCFFSENVKDQPTPAGDVEKS